MLKVALGMAIFALLAKVIAAGKEITIAWRYGRGQEVDTYNLAITLTTWFPAALTGVLTVVLVPVLVGLHKADQARRDRFLAELKGFALLSAIGVTLAVPVIAYLVLPWITQGLETPGAVLAQGVLLSLTPLPLLTLGSAMLVILQQSHNDHRYARLEGIPALTLVLILLMWPWGGNSPLLVGTLLGMVTYVVALAWMNWNRLRSVPVLAWRLTSPEWMAVRKYILIVAGSIAARSLAAPIDQYFAASLGNGAISAIGYANKLVSFLLALSATVIARVALPEFSGGADNKDRVELVAMALRWVVLTACIGAICSLICWFLARDIVTLIYERGAFRREDTMVVAEAFRYSALQLPFYFPLLVISYLLAAFRDFGFELWSALLFIAAKPVVTYVCVLHLGISGITLSNAVLYALTFIFLLAVIPAIRRKHAPA